MSFEEIRGFCAGFLIGLALGCMALELFAQWVVRFIKSELDRLKKEGHLNENWRP